MSTRTQPPNRRPSLTHRIEYHGHTFFVGISLDRATGLPVDVFGSSSRLNSDMDFLVSDACIVISLALQHGATPIGLAKSLKKIPRLLYLNGEAVEAEEPASLIGRILDVLIEEQRAALAARGEAPGEWPEPEHG